MRIFILDSTLRDGTQADQICFGIEEKLLICRRLDEFGIDYIDGGWPGVDPRDREFFLRAHDLNLKHARLAAYGSVRSSRNAVENDPTIKALLEAGTPVVCLGGESWDLHVSRALRSTANSHLAAIADSVRLFKERGREVIYNAEHFFDAYESGAEFALRTLEAAHDAGADVLCLCDTNGWMLTSRLAQVCGEIRKRFPGPLGIHAHNDAELAVANTMAAVDAGFEHVQGCINGYGERCGCANLCSVIPNLELRVGHVSVGRDNLSRLGNVAQFIAEAASIALPDDQPYVGANAFGHTRTAYLRSVLAGAGTESPAPEYGGDIRTLLPDHLPGPANVLWKLTHYRPAAALSSDASRELVDRLRQKEEERYDLATADGTLELLVREAVHPGAQFFNVLSYEVSTRATPASGAETSAAVTIEVNDAVLSATAAGHGPLHALDLALRKCLNTVYASIGNVRLVDYKVRVLEPQKGTAAKVRVLIEWSNGENHWNTAGVSGDLIEASWMALIDATRLELMRLSEKDNAPPGTVSDYSWAV